MPLSCAAAGIDNAARETPKNKYFTINSPVISERVAMTERARISHSPAGHRYTPPVSLSDRHWQVSWLPDHRIPAAFPSLDTLGTVAHGGIAPRSQLRGQRRNSTSFPLRSIRMDNP